MPSLLTLFLLALTAVESVSSQSVVNLGYATYRGSFSPSTNTTEFLSIRYAAPPLGKLRFLAPQPPLNEQAKGIQNATEFPPRCLQASSGVADSNPFPTRDVDATNVAVKPDNEDCLFLDVYTPGRLGSSHASKLPVVVWIHGGGYISGGILGFTPGVDIQNGTDLIRESGHAVVAVIIQYRLGVFGFLAGKEVKQKGNLNAGLLDQEFALKWVQTHISKFGGDPSQVTIWGESAGAGSVLQHVLAHGGKTNPPLFRGAISSSLFLPSQYAFNAIIPETIYSQVLNLTNCSDITCLRNTDVQNLENANVAINSIGFFGTFVTVPVIDGEFIVKRPQESIEAGELNGDALYTITNTFEGALFVNNATASTTDLHFYLANLFPFLTTAQINTAAQIYLNSGLSTTLDQVIGIMGESIFICPTYSLLKGFRKAAKFKSEFAIPPGGHGNDVAYYYPSTNPTGVPPYPNPQFQIAFSSSFLGFVRFLTTNRKFENTITPQWNTWSPSGRFEMLFNRTEAGDPVVRGVQTSTALLQRCAFWESVGAQTAQ